MALSIRMVLVIVFCTTRRLADLFNIPPENIFHGPPR